MPALRVLPDSGERDGPKCQVNRVNAECLHHTVLYNLDDAAKHQTVMHRIIAQSGGWGTAEDQKALRGQRGGQKQALEMRIANYVKAVGDGRMSDALLTALSRAQADKEAIREQIEQG